MSQLQTSLVLTGDGTDLVAAVGTSSKALDGLKDTTRQTGQVMKSARDSASVFERALNEQRASVLQLASGVDAATRSARVFDQQQTELRRALNMGSIDAREYHAVLDNLTKQHRGAAYAAQLQEQATKRLTTATAGGSGGITNFSYQLQDIFTQVGMGVPLMISLGQQAPQILSGFGQVGAILGVVAAGALPLAAALFGLGYQSKKTGEDIKTAADLIDVALSQVGEAQSTLRENALTNLDQIEAKYGTVTASVLSLLQAQSELATQEALSATRTGLDAVFDDGAFSAARQLVQDRQQVIQELRRELSAAQALLPIAVDPSQVQREIDLILADLQDYTESRDLLVDLGVDQSGLQDLVIFQNAIRDALAAENYSGALTVITQMRSSLQDIPNGPLREMLTGIVAAEGALREALNASEDNEEAQLRIETVLKSISGIDVGAGIRGATADANALTTALENAMSAASGLSTQGTGALEDAQINYQFRDNAIERARALAGARFDRRTNPNGTSLPDGAARQLATERETFVMNAGETARLNAARQSPRRSPSSGGVAGNQDHSRAVNNIEREFARLLPSYERDVAALEKWRQESLAALDPAREGYDAFADDVEAIFDEKLAEAYKRDLQRRTDWAAGIERGMNTVAEDVLTFASVSEDLMIKWSGGIEDAFVEMTRTGKFEIADLVDYTLDQFTRLAFQQTIKPGVDGLIGSLLGGLGGLFGGATATQSHSGSTIGTGGVRRSYGPGAPLRADEQLTVTTLGQRVFTPGQIANGATVVDALATAAQAQSGGTQVLFAPQISVENKSSAQINGEVEETNNRDGQRGFKIMLADEVGSALTRKGGGANKQLRNNYGLRPSGVVR